MRMRWRWMWASVGAVFLLAGCSSTRDWESKFDFSEYDRVSVLDFEGGNGDAGRDLGDAVAQALRETRSFEAVSRNRSESSDMVVAGVIRHYRKGSVPARVKYGPMVGNAYLKVEVTVSEGPDGAVLDRFVIDESTLWTGPDARRTGREDVAWLRREVAERIAERLAGID